MASQYVGIDLHRRRSVIVRQNATGEALEQVRIDNDAVALACEMENAGPDPELVLEATYGWYWAAVVLQACGAKVHLAHPLGVKGWGLSAGKERRTGRWRSGGSAGMGRHMLPLLRDVEEAAWPDMSYGDGGLLSDPDEHTSGALMRARVPGVTLDRYRWETDPRAADNSLGQPHEARRRPWPHSAHRMGNDVTAVRDH